MTSDINMGNCVRAQRQNRGIRRFKNGRNIESLMSNVSAGDEIKIASDDESLVFSQPIEVIPNKPKIIKKLEIDQNPLYKKRKSLNLHEKETQIIQ